MVSADERLGQERRRAVGDSPGVALLGGVEHDDQRAAAGIHDAGLSQAVHLHGRPGERFAGRPSRAGEDLAYVVSTGLSSVGSRCGDGQDRALDRPADGRIPGERCRGEAAGDLLAGEVEVVAELSDEGADKLGHDDPAVALRAGQQAVGKGLHENGKLGVGRLSGDGLGPGDERQVGIGAGVAVGHREHVESVDLSPGRSQSLDTQRHPRAERFGS